MELSTEQMAALDEYLDGSEYAYYSDEELAETPAERADRIKAAKTPKGVCHKCGKHIGKGIAFHTKACNG